MRWRTLGICVGLLLAWAVFAGWQYQGYRHERELIRETLHQQSHSLMNAVVGGVRSHRRLGRFFEVQLQGMLDETVKSQDVLTVAVRSEDGRAVLAAGQTELIPADGPAEPGDYWDRGGFRLVERFSLLPTPCDEQDSADGGPGGGLGGGRGHGLGPRWLEMQTLAGGPFAEGGRFAVTLVLDSTRADMLCHRAAVSRAWMAAAGALVLICVALAWRASVRLVAAHGRADLLETEARHWRDLSHAAAGLAHETRNPLGLIRGWTQRLAESVADDPERQGHAQTVIEECDRVTARINQFLAFAKPHKPSPEPVELSPLFDELDAILQPDLEARRVELSQDVPARGKVVWADRELLRQALFNLVQNAIHFSPAGSVVGIAVDSSQNGDSRIAVSDRGPGVGEDSVDSLFTPYFTTRPEGAGLGLAIVKRIAALHGWQVSYVARPGGGSVFSLEGIHDPAATDHPGS